jgi:hypothetical protein
VPRWYHDVTPCVRRAFQLGEGTSDRKQTSLQRLESRQLLTTGFQAVTSVSGLTPAAVAAISPTDVVAVGSGTLANGDHGAERARTERKARLSRDATPLPRAQIRHVPRIQGRGQVEHAAPGPSPENRNPVVQARL